MQLEHLNGKKILITGATGFLGHHLLQALTKSKAEIFCLVRASSNRSLLPPSVKVLEADLHSGNGLDEALSQVDTVVHMASLLFGIGWRDYLQDNVLAANVFGAAIARNKNIQRVVFVSSLAASGPSATPPGVKSSNLACPKSAYGWSKYMSEQTLFRHCGDKLVILRPPIIYGSKDKGLLPYFKAAKKGLVITPGFGRRFPVSIIHAKDMAKVIMLSLHPNAHGIYHCNDGEVHTMENIGVRIANTLGQEAKCFGVPLFIMGISAFAVSLAARLLKPLSLKAPSWNIDKFLEAKESGWLCDGSRMRNELGFKAEVSLELGIHESISGYKADNWL